MIGLDTNVLVRYLTQDDPVQAPQATVLIEQQLSSRNPGFVSLVAMVETAWVLERSYALSPGEIAAAIERLLETDALIVEAEQAIFTAMVLMRKGIGSFADALIGVLGRNAGCLHTMTFDRKALRLADFVPVSSAE